MFDKLVESTKQKQRGRAGRIFFLTGLIYTMLLGAGAVSTILGLNPSLAESYDITKLAPPIPQSESLPEPTVATPDRMATTAAVQASNVVPTHPPPVADSDIIEKYKEPIRPAATASRCEICMPGSGRPNGVAGIENDTTAPPPAPKPKPTPEPAPEPKPAPKVIKVSSISPGMALRRVTPQYSAIAKSIRAAGAVQVQVLISEEGQVIAADAVSGHPTLRPLAVEAARQWLFKPTMLNDVPVKVQGVLTFNFTLN